MGWSFFICSMDLKLFWTGARRRRGYRKVSIRMPQFPTKEWKKARMVSRGRAMIENMPKFTACDR